MGVELQARDVDSHVADGDDSDAIAVEMKRNPLVLAGVADEEQ